MRTIDIILIIILVLGAYRGYTKGLLLEIIAILAFFLAIVGGFKLLHWGVELLNNYIDSFNQLVPVFAFILIFIVIILVVNIIGRILKGLIDLTILGSLDNLGGAILGIFKWAFGLSLIIWITQSIGISLPEEVHSNTYIYPKIAAFAPFVFDYFSDLFPFIEQLFEMIQNLLKG